MTNNILDMEQLEDRLRYWQERLGLRDWGMEIMLDRGFNLGNYMAKIHIMDDKRRARIRMLEPNDYNQDDLLPYDMEQVLVHELLHIHFYPLTKSLGENTAEEQAIEAISWALVHLDRRANEIESHYMQEIQRRPYGFLPAGVQHILYAGQGEQEDGKL